MADFDSPPSDALIACVGETPMEGALFSHWLAIARKGSSPGAPADELRDQVMQFLVDAFWIEGEARARGVQVSDRTVRHVMTQQKHENFETEREFRRFLESSGMTRSDLKFRIRLDILSERIQKKVAGKGSPRTKERRLSRFVTRFRSNWKAHTSCQDAYKIDDCGNTLATG